MKAYITKYALTGGIFSVEAEVCENVSPNMIKHRHNGFDTYAHGNDWHRTWESAVERAEEMRLKKIESLKKSIAKMERLKWEQKE